MPQAGPVQINAASDGDVIYVRAEGQLNWTALPCNTNSITVTYLADNTNDYWNESMATVATNAYTITADQWVWHTNTITTSTTATGRDWVWGDNATTGTYRWHETVKAWENQYETRRVQRAQSDLQRAVAAARGAGDSNHEWTIGEWAEAADVDLEDFTDEQSGLVMDTYLHSLALRQYRDHLDQRRRDREAAAQARAEHLLTSLLSAAQKREWLASRWVTEISPTGRIWRLSERYSGGQALMRPDNPEVRYATLCVHPTGQMPIVDHIVGILLALRNGDEDMLLYKANVHSGALTAEDRDLAAQWLARRNAEAAPAVEARAAANMNQVIVA